MNTLRRKATSILLALAMLASFIPAGALPAQAEVTLKGAGTQESPYEISTAEDLKAFRDLINDAGKYSSESAAWAILVDNIDLEGESWIPIGTSDVPYGGIFDGNNKKISGLYIESDSQYVGLFGCIGQVPPREYAGTVQDLTISGSVSGNGYVGGIVGHNTGNIIGCTNEATVSGTDRDVGGIAGYNGGTIENCSNNGSVENNASYTGGITGYNEGTVKGCNNQGNVSSTAHDIGGIVGRNLNSVENCSNTATVNGGSYSVGGVVGGNLMTDNSVKNCCNTGQVIGEESVGGIVGDNDGIVTNCYNLKDTAENAGGGEEKDANAFHSGEVAWLLQGEQGEAVWVQSNLGQNDSCPELAALASPDAGAKQVFKVSFEVNGTAYGTPKYVCSGDTVSLPEQKPTPEEGSAFLGWQDGSGQIVTEDTAITADTTCTPRWGQIYSVTLETNGGTIAADKNVTQYISGLGATLPAAGDITRDGFTFDGWYESADFSGGAVKEISDAEAGDKTYHAKWLSADTGVTSVTVAGETATRSGNTFSVSFTADKSYPNKDDIVIVLEDNNATKSDLETADGGKTWTFTVTAEDGTTTKDYTIHVAIGLPSITKQPVNATVTEGEPATFSVEADVAGVNYQWQMKQGDVWEDIPNATSSTYTTDPTALEMNGTEYRCMVTGNGGSTYSNAATLTVNARSYTVTVENDGNGTASASPSSATKDTTITLTAEPNLGYVFDKWEVVFGSVTISGDTFTMPAEDVTVKAIFVEVGTYTIGLTAEPAGGGTVSGGGTVTANTDVTITATPNTGYHFVNWTENDQEVSTQASYTIENVQAERNLTANFAKNTYNVNVTASDGGTAIGSQQAVAHGTEITVTATPNAGYHFVNWTENGQAVSNEASYTFAVAAERNLTANFAKNTYNVNVTAGDGGTASGSQQAVEYGTEITVTATPKAGYHFVNWMENGQAVSNEANYTFAVTAERNLTANFAVDSANPSTPGGPSKPAEPEGPATEDSEGWSAIEDEVALAGEGTEIVVDMNGTTEMPASVLENAAGKNVNLTFEMGDDVSWMVNGADIPEDANLSDLDLAVTMDSDDIPVNVIDTVTNENANTVQMALAHEGEFGFTMTLSVPLGAENFGRWANLYHYNEALERMDFEVAVRIDSEGIAKLPMSHASQYAIVIDDESHAAVEMSFSDVGAEDWFYSAVEYVFAQGLMTGTSDTAFSPNLTTTRGMIVSMLHRLDGGQPAERASFSDVDPDAWYADSVSWAVENGIMVGYGDTFGPNDALTREQMAAGLMNFAASKGMDVSTRVDFSQFTDAAAVSSWASEAMQWAVGSGVISGMTKETLVPQGESTRAQTAAMLVRTQLF